jgi:hypothetical protein
MRFLALSYRGVNGDALQEGLMNSVDPQKVLELLKQQASGAEPWAPTAEWVGEVLGCGHVNAGVALVKLSEDGEVRRVGAAGWMPVWSPQGRAWSFVLEEAVPVSETELERRARALGLKPHRRSLRYFLSSPEAWATLADVHGAEGMTQLLLHFASTGQGDRGTAVEAVACACRSHRGWCLYAPAVAAGRIAHLSAIASTTRQINDHIERRMERWIAAAFDMGFSIETTPDIGVHGAEVKLCRAQRVVGGATAGSGLKTSVHLVAKAMLTVLAQNPPEALAEVDAGRCRS